MCVDLEGSAVIRPLCHVAILTRLWTYEYCKQLACTCTGLNVCIAITTPWVFCRKRPFFFENNKGIRARCEKCVTVLSWLFNPVPMSPYKKVYSFISLSIYSNCFGSQEMHQNLSGLVDIVPKYPSEVSRLYTKSYCMYHPDVWCVVHNRLTK